MNKESFHRSSSESKQHVESTTDNLGNKMRVPNEEQFLDNVASSFAEAKKKDDQATPGEKEATFEMLKESGTELEHKLTKIDSVTEILEKALEGGLLPSDDTSGVIEKAKTKLRKRISKMEDLRIMWGTTFGITGGAGLAIGAYQGSPEYMLTAMGILAAGAAATGVSETVRARAKKLGERLTKLGQALNINVWKKEDQKG